MSTDRPLHCDYRAATGCDGLPVVAVAYAALRDDQLVLGHHPLSWRGFCSAHERPVHPPSAPGVVALLRRLEVRCVHCGELIEQVSGGAGWAHIEFDLDGDGVRHRLTCLPSMETEATPPSFTAELVTDDSAEVTS